MTDNPTTAELAAWCRRLAAQDMDPIEARSVTDKLLAIRTRLEALAGAEPDARKLVLSAPGEYPHKDDFERAVSIYAAALAAERLAADAQVEALVAENAALAANQCVGPMLLGEGGNPYCAREAAMREALEWYGEQARLCRIVHSEGDAGRNALDADGGKRARAALAGAEGSDEEAVTKAARAASKYLEGVLAATGGPFEAYDEMSPEHRSHFNNAIRAGITAALATRPDATTPEMSDG